LPAEFALSAKPAGKCGLPPPPAAKQALPARQRRASGLPPAAGGSFARL